MGATYRRIPVILASTCTLALAGCFDHQDREASTTAILQDITEGHSTGDIVPESGQFICLDHADALRGSGDLSDANVEGIQKALMAQGRCTFTGAHTAYTMTAEGRELFTTPHGSLALWAGIN